MQSFDTPAPISVVLDIPAGRVHLVAAERADTTVEVLPANASKGRDVKAAEQTTVSYADGVLRIRAAESGNQMFGPSGSLDVTVCLPAGSRVEATTASCELRGTGRLGEVRFDGAYRQIRIDEAASVHLTAVDGDVEVGKLGGPAQISTARGDIRIAEAGAAGSCSAPRTAASRSLPPRASRPRWTPVRPMAGSATRSTTTASPSSTSAPPPRAATSLPAASDTMLR